jgi:hypothetical protein
MKGENLEIWPESALNLYYLKLSTHNTRKSQEKLKNTAINANAIIIDTSRPNTYTRARQQHSFQDGAASSVGNRRQGICLKT